VAVTAWTTMCSPPFPAGSGTHLARARVWDPSITAVQARQPRQRGTVIGPSLCGRGGRPGRGTMRSSARKTMKPSARLALIEALTALFWSKKPFEV